MFRELKRLQTEVLTGDDVAAQKLGSAVTRCFDKYFNLQ